MTKKYIYPKLCQKDFVLFGFGGAGLGNLLFIFFKALIKARDQGLSLVWPLWAGIKLGPILRHEKDKRFYAGLFRPLDKAVTGLKRFYLLTFARGSVEVFDTFDMHFASLIKDRDYIKDTLLKMTKPRHKKALDEDFTKSINVHVRLGDFMRLTSNDLKGGACNVSIPIDWYVKVIKDLQKELGNKVSFNIFSDGSDEELKPLMQLDNVRRITYGSSIADIIALSQSPVIIASGSSFSMWARFLGNTSCITYTNQLKESTCTDPKGFEYCLCEEDAFDTNIIDRIKKIYE